MPCQPEYWIKWAPVASALLSAIAAAVAALNVWIQNRNALRNRSLDLLLKKEAEFESPRLRSVRSRAAKALRLGADRDYAVDELLDFMESASALVVSKDLGETQAWATFHHWFSHYGHACKGIIESEQRQDSLVWKDFSTMLVRFDAIQLRGSRLSKRYSPEELDRFLKLEESLENNR